MRRLASNPRREKTPGNLPLPPDETDREELRDMISPKELMDDIEWLRLNQPNNRKTWNVCEYAEQQLISKLAVTLQEVTLLTNTPQATCPECERRRKASSARVAKHRSRKKI